MPAAADVPDPVARLRDAFAELDAAQSVIDEARAELLADIDVALATLRRKRGRARRLSNTRLKILDGGLTAVLPAL